MSPELHDINLIASDADTLEDAIERAANRSLQAAQACSSGHRAVLQANIGAGETTALLRHAARLRTRDRRRQRASTLASLPRRIERAAPRGREHRPAARRTATASSSSDDPGDPEPARGRPHAHDLAARVAA